MEKIVHRASDRIVNDLGWLRIHASFRDESTRLDQRQFGTLLILDDATMIPGGRGFQLHPHSNMEIISWVLSGTDEHNDSKNGITLLHGGDVQLMSAGTGIEHAENNYSATDGVHMFQIWILPGKSNVPPNYQIKSIRYGHKPNELYTFVTPDGENDSLKINQNAYLSHLVLEPGKRFEYKRRQPENGVYLMVIRGHVSVGDVHLSHRDAMGVYPAGKIQLASEQEALLLFIEVPMEN